MSAVASQLRTELALASRQGEQLLVSLGIPLLVLVFFSVVDVVPTGTDRAVDYVAPATLALAVISTAMVSLGIGTGFERQYGVLRRLGASPLGTGRWVVAKTALVVLTEVLQVVVLVAVAPVEARVRPVSVVRRARRVGAVVAKKNCCPPRSGTPSRVFRFPRASSSSSVACRRRSSLRV